MRGRKKLWVILIAVVGVLAAVYLGDGAVFPKSFLCQHDGERKRRLSEVAI